MRKLSFRDKHHQTAYFPWRKGEDQSNTVIQIDSYHFEKLHRLPHSARFLSLDILEEQEKSNESSAACQNSRKAIYIYIVVVKYIWYVWYCKFLGIRSLFDIYICWASQLNQDSVNKHLRFKLLIPDQSLDTKQISFKGEIMNIFFILIIDCSGILHFLETGSLFLQINIFSDWHEQTGLLYAVRDKRLTCWF